MEPVEAFFPSSGEQLRTWFAEHAAPGALVEHSAAGERVPPLRPRRG